MTETEFWQLIDEKVDRRDVTELDISQLEQELGNSSAERIAAFGHHFDRSTNPPIALDCGARPT